MLWLVAVGGGIAAALVLALLLKVVCKGDLDTVIKNKGDEIGEKLNEIKLTNSRINRLEIQNKTSQDETARLTNEIYSFRASVDAQIDAVRAAGKDLARPLAKRKNHLSFVLVCASITLSLGIAMMNVFLGWGSKFLSEDSLKVIQPIVDGGSAFWGGMFTLTILVAAGLTGFWLWLDIDMAAKAAGVCVDKPGEAMTCNDDKKLEAEIKWKKDFGLEFDPLKSLATIVAALGPVLTSVFMTAISKAFA